MSILWTLLVGLVVGAVAKLLMPGRDPGGFIITILLGIAGAFVARFVGKAAGLYQPDRSAGHHRLRAGRDGAAAGLPPGRQAEVGLTWACSTGSWVARSAACSASWARVELASRVNRTVRAGSQLGPIIQIALQLLQQSGGLAGILEKFKKAGFGAQANSWVSTGQNMAISPEQVTAGDWQRHSQPAGRPDRPAARAAQSGSGPGAARSDQSGHAQRPGHPRGRERPHRPAEDL